MDQCEILPNFVVVLIASCACVLLPGCNRTETAAPGTTTPSMSSAISVVPLAYEAQLTLDPAASAYDGAISIRARRQWRVRRFALRRFRSQKSEVRGQKSEV